MYRAPGKVEGVDLCVCVGGGEGEGGGRVLWIIQRYFRHKRTTNIVVPQSTDT